MQTNNFTLDKIIKQMLNRKPFIDLKVSHSSSIKKTFKINKMRRKYSCDPVSYRIKNNEEIKIKLRLKNTSCENLRKLDTSKFHVNRWDYFCYGRSKQWNVFKREWRSLLFFVQQ